jgi:hypothetical protein
MKVSILRGLRKRLMIRRFKQRLTWRLRQVTLRNTIKRWDKTTTSGCERLLDRERRTPPRVNWERRMRLLLKLVLSTLLLFVFGESGAAI